MCWPHSTWLARCNSRMRIIASFNRDVYSVMLNVRIIIECSLQFMYPCRIENSTCFKKTDTILLGWKYRANKIRLRDIADTKVNSAWNSPDSQQWLEFSFLELSGLIDLGWRGEEEKPPSEVKITKIK